MCDLSTSWPSFDAPERHKKMDHDPQTHCESESKPKQITWRLVDGRETFALGAADTHCQDHERPDETTSKSSEPTMCS
jgi:hypothetical protein